MINDFDVTYTNLCKDILNNGTKRSDRTGTGTIGIFGTQQRYDLRKGFPLLTTKKIHWKSVVHELLWFIKGDTNVMYLQDNGVKIWNEWCDENGDLGKIYGYQWRNFNGSVDQLKNVVEQIKTNPFSRRHVVSAWNPSEIEEMSLPPCHTMFQLYVTPEGQLDLQLYQR